MENFLEILLTPDNIPVVGMIISLWIVMRVWWNQVKVIDVHLANGDKDKVIDEMNQ